MRLLLIRHGQTPSNVLGLLDTAGTGPGLTDLGVQQAAALAENLAAYEIDAVYASSQLRAQLTAAPLAAARELPVRVRDGLREVAAGDLEMAGDAESIGRYLQTVLDWVNGDLDAAVPGGPTGRAVLARVDEVVREAVDDLRRTAGHDGCAVLVAHGAVLRFWALARATDLAAVTDAVGDRHGLHNTGLIEIEGAPDTGFHVVTWAGIALGGAGLDDGTADGPAGYPERHERLGHRSS